MSVEVVIIPGKPERRQFGSKNENVCFPRYKPFIGKQEARTELVEFLKNWSPKVSPAGV